jgi:very-short-patch-repair endonuclease
LLPYDERLKERSRLLRKNMTAAEEYLWSKIRDDAIKCFRFYRQKPIGIYIADFYCPKAKLIVEVDGGQHDSSEIVEYDKARSEYLTSLGLRILRFTNREILTNITDVLEKIKKNLVKSPLAPLYEREEN